MAIANFQEKLLFYTRQKSRITRRMSDVQMEQLAVTKNISAKQLEYNSQLAALYYDPDYGYAADPETYSELSMQMTSEHEFELSSLNSWETQLELEKESLENQLNEIQTYENNWNTLLKSNVKNDFSYGQIGK